jgi:outer membrane lipoprotein-sorting protein
MSFLRTISTQRLLALLAIVVLAAGGGTAIALAAGGGGPVPPAKPLDAAVHDSLTGPEVRGLSARVEFTNHLVDSAALEGNAPLLKGASGRLWLAAGHLRLELQSDQGDAQLVLDRKSFWVYDVSSHTVYRGNLPQDRKVEPAAKAKEKHHTPSLAEVRDGIARVMRHATLSGAVPGDVAGQPAYDVRIAPKQGGLIGAARLAWDAKHAVPLSVAVFARGSSSPVLELKATDISYGPVPASTFAVTPPKGAKIVDVSPRAAERPNGKQPTKRGKVSGRAAVAHALPFKLVAPSTLGGRRLTQVELVGRNGGQGALATYGRGLNGIAVLQRKAEAGKAAPAQRGEHHGRTLSLPRVNVGGVSAEELVTPLGTVIRFERGGVSYVVIGSVPKSTAEAAARGLVR